MKLENMLNLIIIFTIRELAIEIQIEAISPQLRIFGILVDVIGCKGSKFLMGY